MLPGIPGIASGATAAAGTSWAAGLIELGMPGMLLVRKDGMPGSEGKGTPGSERFDGFFTSFVAAGISTWLE